MRTLPTVELSLLFLFAAAAPSIAAEPDERAKELQAAIDQYTADYSAGDVNKVMDHWTEDADFVDIHGEFHQGRELISALFRRGFAGHPGRKLKLNSASRKFLAPSVAMDDGVLELIEPDGEKHEGRYTVVWTKVGDRWLIRSARDIPIEERQPTEPLPPPLEELAWLLGKWEAKEEGYSIALTCDWELNKNYLVQKFQATGKEVDFQVVKYITFDPVSGKFRSWFFDSNGGFGGGAWTQRDEGAKVSVLAVMPDGQVASSIITWKQEGSDTLLWQSTEREVGGDPLPDGQHKYQRVK